MAIDKIIHDLLIMNLDVLAAKVRIGANSGDCFKFLSDETERFTVRKMIEQAR
jgi:hypothetical protein